MISRLLTWVEHHVEAAALLAGLALLLLDALVRGIAWSWFGATLPALFLGRH
jgi:hypothetical protein